MTVKIKKDAVLLVDAMNIMHRCFHACPEITSKSGIPIGALQGFVTCLNSFKAKYNPKHIIVCSDAHRKTFRNNIYADYKGTRPETPPNLREQFPLMEKYLNFADIPFIKLDEFEADDLIGSLSKKAIGYGYNPYIVSGDGDLHQLVTDEVSYIYLGQKSDIVMSENEVLEKYNGLKPNQLIDYKALVGDVSDNVPGVAGIGKVSATKLLNEYTTLENIYENIDKLKGKQRENLERNKDIAFMSKTLVTIKCDIELNFENLFVPNTEFQLDRKEAVLFLRSSDIKLFKNEECEG